MDKPPRQTFWLRTRRLTLALLAMWLALNLLLPWFARDLDQFQAFGFPLGYWLSAEGALLLYLLIVVVYMWVMDRLEAGLQAQDKAQAARADAAPGAGPGRP
jgi:putative solute:sodium symporter small subunit